MLKFPYKMTARRISKGEGRGSGPQGRISKMRKLVTALLRYERIEGKSFWLDEARGYAERIMQEAHRHGDKHKPTMDMLDYWILEKDLIPKLFKVLVPRYSTYHTACTQMFSLPSEYPGPALPMAVLELKGNPWPPVITKTRDIRNSLINVLVDEARREYRENKFKTLSELQAKYEHSKTEDTLNAEEDLTSDLHSLSLETEALPSNEKTVS